MQKPLQDIDREKTIAEHEKIVTDYEYHRTLDRQNAIEKYITFNSKYPDYYQTLNFTATITNTLDSVQNLSDDKLILNIKAQLLWLSGK